MGTCVTELDELDDVVVLVCLVVVDWVVVGLVVVDWVLVDLVVVDWVVVGSVVVDWVVVGLVVVVIEGGGGGGGLPSPIHSLLLQVWPGLQALHNLPIAH